MKHAVDVLIQQALRAFHHLFSLFCRVRMDIKLMKGKALRKHSLHEKTAASVLLKLFISGNE